MRKGSFGWLILVLALAVPSAVLYKTWSRMDKARRKEMAKKVRLRIPEERLFSTPGPQAGRLSNPIAGQPAAAAVQASAGRAEAAETAPPPQAPPPAPAQELPPSAPEPEAQPAAQLANSGSGTSSPMARSAALSEPKALRDPMVSPYDQYQLDQLELDRKIREQEMKRPKRAATAPVVEEAPVEGTVSLEGIFETESGNRAIVNGTMVAEGDMVGKVKVQKITPRGVLFVYKNKRFMKWMGR